LSPKSTDVIRTSAIKQVVAEYQKQFGKGIFWNLLSIDARKDVPFIKTSLISLNWLFGVGGVPQGRLVEIFGAESSGKTTLCYELIRACQRFGLAGYIDTETSFDPKYAIRCGVDLSRFVLAQPDYGEQAYSILESWLADKRFSIVVLDSLAAMAPKPEADGEVGDRYMGLAARMNSQEMRRISPRLKRTKACVVFTNQVRANLSGYGYQEETGGGLALRHTLQVRIYLKKRDKIMKSGNPIGFYTELTTRKNKIATPFRTIKLPIIFGRGFDRKYELIHLAIEAKVVSKATNGFKLGNKFIGKTFSDAYQSISKDRKSAQMVSKAIQAYLDKKATIND